MNGPREREQLAVDAVTGGGVLCHATEGVFGLAASISEEQAVRKIAALKGRSAGKSFIVVAADFSDVEMLVDTKNVQLSTIYESWPGPETWIFNAQRDVPSWLTAPEGTIAVRITAHAQFRRLCAAAGPVVSTSANISGEPAALELDRARTYFGAQVDFYLNGELDAPGRPSRIRRASDAATLRP